MFHQLSASINIQYGDYFSSVYSGNDIRGQVARMILSPPTNYFTNKKSISGGPSTRQLHHHRWVKHFQYFGDYCLTNWTHLEPDCHCVGWPTRRPWSTWQPTSSWCGSLDIQHLEQLWFCWLWHLWDCWLQQGWGKPLSQDLLCWRLQTLILILLDLAVTRKPNRWLSHVMH